MIKRGSVKNKQTGLFVRVLQPKQKYYAGSCTLKQAVTNSLYKVHSDSWGILVIKKSWLLSPHNASFVKGLKIMFFQCSTATTISASMHQQHTLIKTALELFMCNHQCKNVFIHEECKYSESCNAPAY